MTLNTLADLFGPSLFSVFYAGAWMALAALLMLCVRGCVQAWPEWRFRYRQWRRQSVNVERLDSLNALRADMQRRAEGKHLRVVRGKAVW